jgi:hypothetical protein
MGKRKNLHAPHQVVFLDETWVNANASESKMWSDGSSQSVKKRTPITSTRHIVSHDVNTKWICVVSLIFVSRTKSGDYHDSMSVENSAH